MKYLIINYMLLIFLFNISNLKAQTQEVVSAEELAKQLANPVASLISVPIQNNFDFNVGSLKGFRYNLNVQPVIPVSLSEKWNMISRTIVPIIYQSNVTGDNTSEIGVADIVQSIFFSPKEAKNDLVWGVGPVLLFPTASENIAGANKWGVGPNMLILKLQGQWTYGFLANHIWSYAGNGPNDINATFFQPFVTYANKGGASLTMASENTQSWENNIFGGFTGLYYAKVLKFGKQMMQLGGGPKIYYGNNSFNPDWGIRVNIILLFPK